MASIHNAITKIKLLPLKGSSVCIKVLYSVLSLMLYDNDL